MDAQEGIVTVQILVSAAILGYASILDWRTRRVSNRFWIALSLIALILLVARVLNDGEPLEYLAVLIPIGAILADVYLDFERLGRLARIMPIIVYGMAIASTVYLASLWMDERYFAHLLTAPLMMLVVVLLYMIDIIRGGADAKALIALSVMFPFYPSIGAFPMIAAGNWQVEVLFPFSFIVLVNAAIIVAFTPLIFMARNLAEGEFRYPQGFLGYRLDADIARTKHVWLMERMSDGEHRTYSRPMRQEDLSREIDLLVDAGHERVWVTPKIPFIIPMFVSLVFTTVVGNLLIILMGL